MDSAVFISVDGLTASSGTETAAVLCYLDNGLHTLLKSDFTDGLTIWDHTTASAQVISNSLASLSYDSTGDSSQVEQAKIAVKPNTNHTISHKAKISIKATSLTIGVTGAQINDASYDSVPATWKINADCVALSDESSTGTDNYFFNIQMDLTIEVSSDELTLYFNFENIGYAGQSATIDDVVLIEN